MKIRIAVVTAVIVCVAAAAAAQQSKKTMRSNGRVISVAADSITIKPGMNDLTFAIDASTAVMGKGVGTKIRAMKAANQSAQVTDLVDEYDSVTVEYEDAGGGTLRAKRIDVRVKGFKKQ